MFKLLQFSRNNFFKLTKRNYPSSSDEIYQFEHSLEKRPPLRKVLFPKAKYAGENTVTLVTGTPAGIHGAIYIKKIFHHVSAPIIFEEICAQDCEEDLTMHKKSEVQEIVLSVLRNRYALNIDVHHTDTKKTEVSQMNNDLNLFVCVINVSPFPGFKMTHSDVDIVLLIQNSSGNNTKLEYQPVNGVVETLKVTTRDDMRRLVTYAFQYATKNNRKKITFVHKISHLPLSDGLFIESVKENSAKYPNIIIEELEADYATYKLVMNPKYFDVICTNDRYGTMLTSVACGVCGGPNLFACGNIGENHAVFQPLENKLSIPLQGELSPYGVISASVQLLLHLGHCSCATAIWNSLIKTMLVDDYKTVKYGGKYTQMQVVDRVIENLKETKCSR